MIWYRGSLCGTVERRRVIARATASGFGFMRDDCQQTTGFHTEGRNSLRGGVFLSWLSYGSLVSDMVRDGYT